MDRTETYPEVGGEESGLVPPQGHKGEWPKKIRTLTAVELDRLTIDGDGRFYWDGRLVNYEAQRQEARPADLDALAILDRAAVELSGQPQGAGDPQAYGDAPAVEQARVVLHLLPRGVGTAEMDDVDRVVRVAVARVDRVDLRAADAGRGRHVAAGEGRFDTAVMRGGHGQVLSKGGAEGIQCLSRVGEGLGLAIKVEDGASRAKHAVALQLMRQLEWLTPITLEELSQRFLEPSPGVRLEVSGELRFDNGR